MSNYYLVDELENDDMCFGSIEDIKESADDFGLKLDELTIYETEMIPLKMDAKHIIEQSAYNCDMDEFSILQYISDEKIKELQDFLNKWCSEINTNTYKRSRKLSTEEVYKRLELENE